MYDFKAQNLKGKFGEKILDNWLSHYYKIVDVSNVPKYQILGIDRILTRPDESKIKVEYKYDIASSRTGNLFFETVSIDNKNIPGWGWSSQADYWIFLLSTPEVIVIAPGEFRNLVWQLRTKLSEKRIPNKGYKTIGVPIPLEKVRKIAHYVQKLDKMLILNTP